MDNRPVVGSVETTSGMTCCNCWAIKPGCAAVPLDSAFQLKYTGCSAIIWLRSSPIGVMFFFRRSSEEQAKVLVVGLMSQMPLAFWNRATVPEATEALPTCKRYCGDVVPMPTLPAK